MLRVLLVMVLAGFCYAASAAPKNKSDVQIPDYMTPEQAYLDAMRQSIGAPARTGLGDQARLRLSEDLVIIPRDPASRMLRIRDMPLPEGLIALLLGSKGIEAPGYITFVPSGFVDADEIRKWSADDIIASINDSLQRDNPERLKQGLEAIETRRWIEPPRYDPESHQLVWAVLILPTNARPETDGQVLYQAAAFGREGYILATIPNSVQESRETIKLLNDYLAGLTFLPGKAATDVTPGDKRSPDGIAKVLGVTQLRKSTGIDFWSSDELIPVAGGLVSFIGATALLFYIQRHRREESRRW